ncbi:hypothetical protein BCD48_07295 [Pseudofrankia sp. BMG5.36]|nr:hypothetical protein BCD48_07295 [Pseudofrankia sp. BMG5.36]
MATRRVVGAPDTPLVAAGFLGLVALLEVVVRAGSYSDRTTADLSTAMLLGLGATAPLAMARSRPATAAAVITAATALTLASGEAPTIAGTLGLLTALFLVGLRRRRGVALPMLVPFALDAVVPFGDAPVGGRYLGVTLLALAAVALGGGAARRERAETRSRAAADRAARDSLLAHVARSERARIARELHDVVAHHISLIAVQAETARLTTAGLPADGARQLSAIGDTARQALAEMRRLLGVLRDDAQDAERAEHQTAHPDGAARGGGEGPGHRPTREPQPGLEQLIDLIDEARAATGVSTRLIVAGRVEPLDPGVELTAYRIVQEALTNSRRHAAGAPVDVELRYNDGALLVRVRDAGPGRPSSAPVTAGHGLAGMRERVAMVGGRLRAGQSSTEGFLIEAELPTAADRLQPARFG